MSITHYSIRSSGCIRIRHNLEVKVFGWNILMKVSDATSESRNEHFHVAWGRIHNAMHSKFGAVFCNAYGTRIRSDIKNAIQTVTEAYYCVEASSAEFDVTTEEVNWKAGSDFQALNLSVVIIPLEDSREN